MSDPKWVSFSLVALPHERRKTSIWRVIGDDGSHIGEVKWHGPWRCYSFFPEPNSVFERTCLRDIANFTERETREHLAANRARLEALVAQ